jgi:hypothetical protein
LNEKCGKVFALNDRGKSAGNNLAKRVQKVNEYFAKERTLKLLAHLLPKTGVRIQSFFENNQEKRYRESTIDI